jgi:hypothetical protein
MKLRISSIAALALTLGFRAVDDGYAQEYPAGTIKGNPPCLPRA